jgi:hypothetical protein
MRRLTFLFALFLLLPVSAWAAPQYVGGNIVSGATPLTNTYSSTIHNFLVAGVYAFNTSATFAISDSAGQNWSSFPVKYGATTATQLFYMPNSAAVTWVKVTITNSGGTPQLAVAEFSGVATTSPLDTSGGNGYLSNTGTNSTWSSGSFAETSGDLIIGWAFGGGTPVHGSGFSSNASISDSYTMIEYLISSGASTNATYTSSWGEFNVTGAAFKPSAGGPLAAPTFNVGTGTYNNNQSIVLTPPGGATACYNESGTATATTPGTCDQNTYSTPISVTATGTTISAISTEVGQTNSSATSATYTLTVATPTALPGAGVVVTNGHVALSDATSGATILYAVGSAPSCPSTGTTYTTPIVVPSAETLEAIGCLTNYNASSVLSAAYTTRAAQNWYVSNAGSDSNTGVDTSHTWAHAPGGTGCTGTCASTALVPGDSILLNKGDSWTSTTITVGYAGTALDGNITLGSYGSGAQPIVAAAANNPAITANADNRGYWTINGLNLQATGAISGIARASSIYHNLWDGSGGNSGQVPGWVVENNTSNASFFLMGPNTVAANNTFNGTGNGGTTPGNQSSGASWAAITIDGSGGTATGTQIFSNNISYWTGRGLWFMGSQGVAYNNIIHDIITDTEETGAGIDFDGYLYPASGNSDYGNTIYNCGIGISHENQTNYHTYDNWIYNTPWAITNIHYSAHGSTADQRSVAANGQIDRNIIYNSQYAFLVIDTNTIKFWNNTANVGSGSSPYAFYVDSTSTYISALDFRNNIIAGTGWTYPIYVPDNASIWSYLDYSDIVPTGTTVLYEASGGAKTLANLQGSSLMTHGITGNPLFANPSGAFSSVLDFTLLPSSPAIAKGVSASLTTDYFSIPLKSPPDAGACQFDPGFTF